MDQDEQIENRLYGVTLIKNVLGMDFEQYERYKLNVTKGMVKFGNSFFYHIGMLLRYCDIQESVKILHMWQKECSEYDMIYRIYKAKKEAKEAGEKQ